MDGKSNKGGCLWKQMAQNDACQLHLLWHGDSKANSRGKKKETKSQKENMESHGEKGLRDHEGGTFITRRLTANWNSLGRWNIDSLHLGDGHWGPYGHHYSYLASATGLQGHGFPPYPLDSALAGVSPSSQDSCSSSLPLPGLGDRVSSVTSSQTFQALNDPSGNLSLKTDPLLVSRYNNAMAAVAANSELCLSDRLTELRQGLTTGGSNTQPSTTVSLLSNSTNPPYLSVSHAGYGLLSSSYYNASGCTSQGPTGMYLNPPVVPPSLLYPQLYTSIAHNQLHPSVHILGGTVTSSSSDLLRSPESQRSDDENVHNSSNGVSRGSSTGSVASSNGGSSSSIANLMAQVATTQADSSPPSIDTSCTSTVNGTTTVFNVTSNGHSDNALWRPY